MKKGPLLIVTIERGLVTSVTCDDPEVCERLDKAFVIDCDTEGAEPEELFPVRFHNGRIEQRVVHLTEVTETDLDTAFIRERL